jgi:hypothetical protein
MSVVGERAVGRVLIVACLAAGLTSLMVMRFVLVVGMEFLLLSVPLLVAIEVGRSEARAESMRRTISTPSSS